MMSSTVPQVSQKVYSLQERCTACRLYRCPADSLGGGSVGQILDQQIHIAGMPQKIAEPSCLSCALVLCSGMGHRLHSTSCCSGMLTSRVFCTMHLCNVTTATIASAL